VADAIKKNDLTQVMSLFQEANPNDQRLLSKVVVIARFLPGIDALKKRGCKLPSIQSTSAFLVDLTADAALFYGAYGLMITDLPKDLDQSYIKGRQIPAAYKRLCFAGLMESLHLPTVLCHLVTAFLEFDGDYVKITSTPYIYKKQVWYRHDYTLPSCLLFEIATSQCDTLDQRGWLSLHHDGKCLPCESKLERSPHDDEKTILEQKNGL